MGWFRGVQFRTRVALVSALAVALTVVIVAAASYVLTRNQLLDQIDESLERRVDQLGFDDLFGGAGPQRGRLVPGGVDEFDALYVQLVAADGQAVVPFGGGLDLPVDDIDRSIAKGDELPMFRDIQVDDVRLRMYTAQLRIQSRRGFGLADDVAVQVARSLREVESSLSRLGLILFLGGGLGVVAASGIGLVVARSVLRPIEELTGAAENVAATQKLDARIDIASDDEVGRLAAAFNDMLAALNESKVQQRQLVRDASHELRTPLTALRTNIELLARGKDLPQAERDRLLEDVTIEVEELSSLVSELVDLATDVDVDEVPTTMDLVAVSEAVADRYRRRTGRDIVVTGDRVSLAAKPTAIDRAIRNLVDNAVKWSPAATTIDVSISSQDSTLKFSVADRGPGIAPGDRPKVFDRFYRSDEARTMPGSGLGLAIVARIVVDHGGDAFVEERPGGGAIVGFTLPLSGSTAWGIR